MQPTDIPQHFKKILKKQDFGGHTDADEMGNTDSISVSRNPGDEGGLIFSNHFLKIWLKLLSLWSMQTHCDNQAETLKGTELLPVQGLYFVSNIGSDPYSGIYHKSYSVSKKGYM